MHNSLPKLICSLGSKLERSHFPSSSKVVIVKEGREGSSPPWEFILQSPLQLPFVAEAVARLGALWEVEIVDGTSSADRFLDTSLFTTLFKEKHQKASMRLSDGADFGVSLFRNTLSNLAFPHQSIAGWKGAFKGVPAILVGAGPSLDQQGDLLPSFRGRALIIAGGHGCEKVSCLPDVTVSVDKNPLASVLYPQAPLFFQGRMAPENQRLFQGKRFLIPDGHFPFLNELAGEFSLFDGGWTVGNCMASLALFFGCDPIVSLGLDFCGKKENQIAEKNRLGQQVWTQGDWMMAKEWMQELSLQRKETRFFNTAEEGLEYWTYAPLSSFSWEKIPDLERRLTALLEGNGVALSFDLRERLEKEKLHFQRSLREEESPLFETLLSALWDLWRPVFQREFPYLLSEEELCLHRRLFFEQVIQEYLDVL